MTEVEIPIEQFLFNQEIKKKTNELRRISGEIMKKSIFFSKDTLAVLKDKVHF